MKQLSVKLTRSEIVGGWIYYCIQLLILPSVIVTANFIAGNPFSETICNVILFGINFLVIAILFRHYLLENLKIATAAPLRCIGIAAMGIGAYWVLSIFVQYFILFADPDFFNVNDAYIDSMAQDNYTLIFIATVILAPIVEECLYRGLMFGAIYNRSKLAAYLLTSIAFAIVHVIGYVGMYNAFTLSLCLLQYLPAGLCLAWAYARNDSVWAPILMHMTINQLSIALMR